jgi:hypothetical protein
MGTPCDNYGVIGPQNPIASPTAKEAVLIANTPTFLLDRLRGDPSVRYVVDSMAPLEILDALECGLSKAPTDPVGVVTLYVYLTALGLTDPSNKEAWGRIDSLDLSPLEWGETLKKLLRVDAVPTTVSSLIVTS